MIQPASLKEIASLLEGELHGNANARITGVAAQHEAGPEDITWATTPRYVAALKDSNAAAAVIPLDTDAPDIPTIRCRNVEWATVRLFARFASPTPAPPCGVDPSALVATDAVLGENVHIGPNVVIESGARIGDRTILCSGTYVGHGSAIGEGCRLWPNVVIREGCQIGDRVRIHANSVIGSDGFGYVFHDGAQHHVPHLGSVIIEDDVEIGACCCVDRAKVGSTRIGRGAKIDNLVQVAHNVSVGAGSILCAQVGIAGSTSIGKFAVMGGQVGIRDNITLGDQVAAAACSCIPQDLPDGARVAGMPAVDASAFLRQNSALKRLPDLLTQFRKLTQRIEKLEAAANHQSNG